MTDNDLARIGNQDLLPRFEGFNRCAFTAARRAALDTKAKTRINLGEEVRHYYASLTDEKIAILSVNQPLTFFRALYLGDALACGAVDAPQPDNELVRRYTLLARDLAHRCVGHVIGFLHTPLDDTSAYRTLSDDQLEHLQRNPVLVFEPFIVPNPRLCSDFGWNSELLMGQWNAAQLRTQALVDQRMPAGEVLERV